MGMTRCDMNGNKKQRRTHHQHSHNLKYGMNKNVGLLINSSRGIIFASNGTDFAEKAREEALKLQQEMDVILSKK
jgi:hypothetical protein